MKMTNILNYDGKRRMKQKPGFHESTFGIPMWISYSPQKTFYKGCKTERNNHRKSNKRNAFQMCNMLFRLQ